MTAVDRPRTYTGKTTIRTDEIEEGTRMMELIGNLPDGVVGVQASGKVTKEDYEAKLIPAVQATIEAQGKVRLLYVLDDDFDGYSLGAMWQDTKVGMGHFRDWERIAVVTDADWLEKSVQAVGWLMPGEVRGFDEDDLDDARAWVTEGLA
jgi:hypothetical protein